MKYFKSTIDEKNEKWFRSEKPDMTVNSLMKIQVKSGSIRSVFSSEITFEYPITAIVGRNGSGKSTFLSLIACAFHNDDKTFIPQSHIHNKNNGYQHYYTYKDFFVFTKEESGINHVEIVASYLSSNGMRDDLRKKTSDGKWKSYATRPKRKVTFLGISRIVPPSESRNHVYNRNNFENRVLNVNQIDQLKKMMSTVFGVQYNDIQILSSGNCRLVGAKKGTVNYTGFNMGAGENAVCTLLTEILLAGRGALIVVDEIELGLHVQAQKKLMDVLKELCNTNHCQIIMSTHSEKILEKLPPNGRVFVSGGNNKTDISIGITPEYAFGKLSGQTSKELSILVEDTIAKTFLENVLPKRLRERIDIFPIGSDQAVLHQAAAHYREGKNNFLIFLDGDKRNKKQEAIKTIFTALETRLNESKDEFESMMDKRLNYIPGKENPEKALLGFILRSNDIQAFADDVYCDVDDLTACLEGALVAKVHSEFYELSQSLTLSEDALLLKSCAYFWLFRHDGGLKLA